MGYDYDERRGTRRKEKCLGYWGEEASKPEGSAEHVMSWPVQFERS
jgi:hypothetical protein